MKIRLIVNGLFCVGLIVLFLPMFIVGVDMLINPMTHPNWDADQEGAALTAKVLNLSAGIFVAAALVSLVRTVRRWRDYLAKKN